MKIKLITVGKTTDKPCAVLLTRYAERIKKYCDFIIKEIPDIKVSAAQASVLKLKEAALIKKEIDSTDVVILLDEKGKQFTSVEFSQYITQKQTGNSKKLVFVIGGAFGFADDLYERANETLALSKSTFPHQLVRVIFAEQLYRAFSILNNEPYHHI